MITATLIHTETADLGAEVCYELCWVFPFA